MRRTLAVVALLGYLCCVASLPATSKQIDDDVELIPHKETHVEQPIIDTDAGFGFDGFSNPLGDLFESLGDIMNRVRKQMNDLVNRFPGFRTGNITDDLPDFPKFGGEIVPFPQFPDIDLSKGNTTSETKIIDGHKVVINDTQYHKDSDNGSAFFRVRVIDVRPQETNTEKGTDDTTATTAVSPKDREALENSIENEIVKQKEAIYYQPLESDHLDSTIHFQPPSLSYVIGNSENSEWNDLNTIEHIEDNALHFGENQPAVDLSRDTYVNDLLAKAGATTNADAELIDVTPATSTGGPTANKFQPKR